LKKDIENTSEFREIYKHAGELVKLSTAIEYVFLSGCPVGVKGVACILEEDYTRLSGKVLDHSLESGFMEGEILISMDNMVELFRKVYPYFNSFETLAFKGYIGFRDLEINKKLGYKIPEKFLKRKNEISRFYGGNRFWKGL